MTCRANRLQSVLVTFPRENRFAPSRKWLRSWASRKWTLWWKYGGPRDAHLHLGNEIYMVDRVQWKEFTQALAQSMGIEIDRAKKIDFAGLAQKAAETELLKRG